MKTTLQGAAILAASIATLFLAGAVDAQDTVTSQPQIERALARPEAARTRGLRLRATNEEGKSGTSAGEAPPAEARIDLNIPFELNSSELKPQAVVQLEQLGSALKSAALGASVFMVAGHTDAKGNADYNRQLSLQRANAVKTYLVARGVDAGRLKTAGEGEGQLLTPDDPENAVNRRVEIRNLGSAP
jgi:outer membrane protein OmpA-like peptidoglycan-associated protein